MIVFLISAVLEYICRSYSGEHIGSGFGISCSEVKKRKNVSIKLVKPWRHRLWHFFSLKDGSLYLGLRIDFLSFFCESSLNVSVRTFCNNLV